MKTIGVVGGGAWGTALAQVAAEGGETLLWARETEVVESIRNRHENSLFLPGIALRPAIAVTGDLEDLAACDALLVVTPAQHMRSVLAALPRLRIPLILCAKGMEEATTKLMHDVAREEQPESPLAVLSGPTFAHEVAAGLPAAVTLAVEDRPVGEALRSRLALPWFRPYLSDDVVGAEIGGAVKNVLAIACGVVEGRKLGLNARSALISRGFAEMTRFGLARGARADTLAGLSGLGDLVLTCSSTNSRNFSLGKGLGEGSSAAALLADRRTVAEGAFTAPVLARAAQDAGVDMPITSAVCALLSGQAAVDDVVEYLLSRPLKVEGA
ncbi:NAD(P)H-dependent glycerol-3-phosphate dehydrogenase [Sphingosinicella rhizophila]|uniref:Glycerol-3-phosphate dehydrogenase [NAD(P)+] n=1 Tax=Sphingosinicella rhizophila TaxID=3050082 RepID=A0ABU3Q866_9SPHN|nr:NAD(P)H-dependent glycerol-3-phosphate dehydrogenase [Sphingosinicella sp. GR2756]MDT9599594.1 NAD(P)H-dependent glycerol-3-phosphate dehydrogenase [Sphingosinicella sp. GR2756]